MRCVAFVVYWLLHDAFYPTERRRASSFSRGGLQTHEDPVELREMSAAAASLHRPRALPQMTAGVFRFFLPEVFLSFTY